VSQANRWNRIMNRHIDIGSFIIALITLGLFVASLFIKGLTHDLFLETGVFLVSVKIIVMAHRNGVEVCHLNEKLDTILEALLRKNDQSDNMTEGSQDRSNPRE
jgi:hypothetical protein